MRVKVKRYREGAYQARLEPLDGCEVGALGADPAAALHNASRLLDNAIARPEIQAVLPPGTVAAVKLLRGATSALRRGELPEFLEKLPTSAARTVARTIRKVLPW